MDGDDPDITILDPEPDQNCGLAAAHADEFQVFRGRRESDTSVQDPYRALSFAYQDLKKRYNILQDKIRQGRARQRASFSGETMSHSSRNDSSGSRENTPHREFSDGRRSPTGINHNFTNGSTSVRSSFHLETDSCGAGNTYVSLGGNIGDKSFSLKEFESLQRENQRLQHDLEESHRDRNSLQHKLVGYEQVYSKITKGKNASTPRGIDTERENLELQKQVKALEGALREKRRQDSVSQNASPRGRSPSSLENLSSKELQDVVSSVMTSREQLRQLKEQIRQQNEVIRMLITRTPSSMSTSAPNPDRWLSANHISSSMPDSFYDNTPLTDEDVSMMGLGARPKIQSNSPAHLSTSDISGGYDANGYRAGQENANRWREVTQERSDSLGRREAVEHAYPVPDSPPAHHTRREPTSNSEYDNHIDSRGTQASGHQRVSSDSNLYNPSVGGSSPSHSHLIRRASEGAVGRQNFDGGSARLGSEASGLDGGARATTDKPRTAMTRDYNRRRPMSDGNVYGEFDIGMTAPKSNGRSDSLEPLVENDDLTPLTEDLAQLLATSDPPSYPSVQSHLENRYRPPTEYGSPRPLNIERNIDYLDSTHDRSYDNTMQNVNLDSGARHKFEPESTGSTSVFTSSRLGGVKPVPPQNLYSEEPSRNETQVKQPPASNVTISNVVRQACPICHTEYRGLSTEAFENHVMECVIRQEAAGSEDVTLTAMSPAQTRSCPMCNRLFDDCVSQADYEKHVDEHFEGNSLPSPSFEFLDP